VFDDARLVRDPGGQPPSPPRWGGADSPVMRGNRLPSDAVWARPLPACGIWTSRRGRRSSSRQRAVARMQAEWAREGRRLLLEPQDDQTQQRWRRPGLRLGAPACGGGAPRCWARRRRMPVTEVARLTRRW